MQGAHLLAVAVAGAAGAVARHVATLIMRGIWPDLPLATAIVNVAGCFGFGLCWGLATERWSPLVATAVLAGFFGAFTTFSSFAFDCHELLQSRRYALVVANVLGQNVLGLLALIGGITIAGGRT